MAKKKTREELLAAQASIARELSELGDVPPKAPVVSKDADLESRRGPEDFLIKPDTETVVFQPRHHMMAKTERRQQDNKPQRYFYYKRMTDDAILCFPEKEAALIANRKPDASSHGNILRQIGVSDGSAYQNYLMNCGVKPGQIIPKKLALEILRGAHDADLKAAEGHYAEPMAQNIHFDASFPMNQRAGFVPPA